MTPSDTPNPTPQTTPELLAALADGELDLSANPEAFEQIAGDPHALRQVADQQRLRRSVASAMDDPSMRCPDAVRAQIQQLAQADKAQVTAPPAASAVPVQADDRPPVLARIGRWAPAAVAAVMLLAATAVFFAARPGTPGTVTPSVLDVRTVQSFGQRHIHCAESPGESLHGTERFGQGLEELPGNLDTYFDRSIDGRALDLSAIRYDYQLAGVCGIPGSGSVHIVYQHHDDPNRAMSLWIGPTPDRLAGQMQSGRLYVETADNLEHPVVFWEDNGLIYYLVGDSLQDVHDAVQTLHPPA